MTVFESAHSMEYFHLDGWVQSISVWLLEVIICNTKLSLSPSSDLSALHNEKQKQKLFLENVADIHVEYPVQTMAPHKTPIACRVYAGATALP